MPCVLILSLSLEGDMQFDDSHLWDEDRARQLRRI